MVEYWESAWSNLFITTDYEAASDYKVGIVTTPRFQTWLQQLILQRTSQSLHTLKRNSRQFMH